MTTHNCICLEIGTDGTNLHSGSVDGPYLSGGVETYSCENHRQNYLDGGYAPPPRTDMIAYASTRDAEIARLKLERDNFAEIASFKEAEAISEYTRAERAESSNVKLREIVEELANRLEGVLMCAARLDPVSSNKEHMAGVHWSDIHNLRDAAAKAQSALRRAQELSKQEGNK